MSVKIFVAGIGAALIVGAIWMQWHDGKVRDAALEAARAENTARSLEAIQKRGWDDVEIGKMDNAGLCHELGGKWLSDQGICE